MKPFISLCMIVKNEEKVLNRCLSSVANLIDEMIIIDTGSTDNTKKIALQYTNNVYSFKWSNDFSAARNYASEKASGEWILVLDADEYIDEENFKDFIRELHNDNGLFDTYTAKILNFTGFYGESLVQNYHSRIYKNNRDIVYYRHIHEQLKSAKDEQLKTRNSNLLIFHSGYLKDTVKKKNKNERNRHLLEKELNTGSQQAFDYFNFGNEYFSIGEYEKALKSYLQAYKLKGNFRTPWVSYNIIQIINCLMRLQRYNDALKVIKDAEEIYAGSPEFPYLKGEIFLIKGQLDDAKQMYFQILNNQEKYIDIILMPDVKELKPHNRLGKIYLYEDDFDNSIYHYSSVLNIDKYNKDAINKVVYVLNNFHTAEEITNFLKSNELVNGNNIIDYVRASFEVGNPSLAVNLLNDYNDEFVLLTKVAHLKELCINNHGDIEQFEELFTPDIMKTMIESNWINIVDLILLNDYKVVGDYLLVFNSLNHNGQVSKLLNLLNGEESVTNIDNNLITHVLQLLFVYKKYDLCNVILEEIENSDEYTIHKVAKILFSNGFKGESLQLYSLCDWNLFNEQDFINIITGLIESGNLKDALDVSKYAIVNKDDFRFYKFAIEILNTLGDDEKKENLITNALMEYTDSQWLKNQYLQS
ncbi:TPR domain-containing glycosyltransferase [Mesobacillus jeotgali]|uniref:tetratricopeptide repeat-containing glycosyltransferase family 2 protein n=1 Tax=Mesobacillus jeotgali TaxID=129985 RepID=UPI001786871A|nr:TPR domain-containing glycosyltransferase [Mesobacillus jeotgali]UYZ21609.1 glycosyltransferase [Mesobacillus jeotgali]